VSRRYREKCIEPNGPTSRFCRLDQSILFNPKLCYLSSIGVRSRAVVSRIASHERAISMWGGIVGLIIQLISGAVGGNIAGSALKQYNLGTLGNSIAGVIGGGVGAQIIGALLGGGTGAEAAAGGLDIGSIIGQIVSGGAGGGILMVIVGLIKQAMGGQPAS
jgi:hypothetical protein